MTWLYGPLQTGDEKSLHLGHSPPENSHQISTHNSFLNKKPILKKRSMSEIMLQRSLSASSLLKQAAAAVQAQQSDIERPGLARATSDYVTYPFSSRRMSRDNPSVMSSITSSGIQSPGTGERRHIHFNEQVEQCIAVDVKGEDDEDATIPYYDESDSDDGAIMMKRSNSKKRLPSVGKKSSSRTSSSTESKTIAMLPSTTLKYREDTPEPPETAMKHSHYWSPSKLSPSPSQETLKPSKPSSRMLLGDDDDDDPDTDWEPPQGLLARRDSLSVNKERYPDLHSSGSSSSLNGEPSSGMRRTPSGMFMPYEEEDEAPASEGLFGKVVDTVNTAKDIAHVIWNVGWRR